MAAAVALAPKGLLRSRKDMAGWKASVRQLEDQSAAGVAEMHEEVAAQAVGLAEFAEQVLKTPYAVTLLRPSRRRARMDEDREEDDPAVLGPTNVGGVWDLLQRLEDSVAHLRGELGIHPPESRYITLHGGVGALGDDYVRLYKDYKMMAQGLSTTVVHVNDAKAEAVAARLEAGALAVELEQLHGTGTGSMAALQGLRRELLGGQGGL